MSNKYVPKMSKGKIVFLGICIKQGDKSSKNCQFATEDKIFLTQQLRELGNKK